MHGWARTKGHDEPQQLVAGVVAGRGLLAVCLDERWCARSMRHRGRVVGRRVSCRVVVTLSFFFNVGQLLISERTSLGPKPSQEKVLTGAANCAKHKSTSPCLIAIPAFDRIARLSNRQLTSSRGISLR